MCNLICDVITYCVLSCDTGKIKASDKIMFERQKSKESMEIKIIFYTNLHLKHRLEFRAC